MLRPGQPTRSNVATGPPFGSITVARLSPGATYTCLVAAGNPIGFGNTAPSASMTLPTAPILAPTGVVAVAGPSTGTAVVSFTPVSDSPPGNGGSTLTGYLAECSVSGEPTRSTSAGASVTSIKVKNLTPGTSYTCAVYTINAVGTGPASDRSPPVVPG